MVNKFLAVLEKCEKCGEKYMPAHQSAECPHERFVDLMVNKDRLPAWFQEGINQIIGFGENSERTKKALHEITKELLDSECAKPSEGRLLTDIKGIAGLIHKLHLLTDIETVLKEKFEAQDAKTASIKDEELRLADKNYLDLKNAFDERVKAERDKKDAEATKYYAEKMSKAIERLRVKMDAEHQQKIAEIYKKLHDIMKESGDLRTLERNLVEFLGDKGR